MQGRRWASRAVGFAAIGLGVGPFLEHGALVALDFAVGLRPGGAGALVLNLGSEGVGEHVGAVAAAVVGQDPAHGDPGIVEEGVGPLPESGGGVFALVFQQFAVGQPRVVVDGGVDVTVPGPTLAVELALGSVEEVVIVKVGDAARLFDVHVHQIARSLVLVSAWTPRVRPNRGAGGRVGERQS